MRIARNCSNCKFADVDIFKQPCQDCDKEDAWEPMVDQTRVMALEEQVAKLQKFAATTFDMVDGHREEIAELKEKIDTFDTKIWLTDFRRLEQEIAELREMYDQISWDEAISLGKGMRDAELGNFVENKAFDEEGWYIEKNGKRMWRHPVEGLMGLVGYIDRTLEEPVPPKKHGMEEIYIKAAEFEDERPTKSEHMWSHLTDVSYCNICDKFAHNVGYDSECQTTKELEIPHIEGKPVKGYCFQKVYCSECMGYDLCESKSKVGIYNYEDDPSCSTCEYEEVDSDYHPCVECDSLYSEWTKK